MSDEHKPKTIELVIVYGTNKKLKATDPETIEQVKEGAFGLFGIDLSELGASCCAQRSRARRTYS